MIRAFAGLFFFAIALGATPASGTEPSPIHVTTNAWALGPDGAIERTSLVIAPEATMAGEARNDSFWVSQYDLNLEGRFLNDVWALADNAQLTGNFSDHARVLGRTVNIDGTVSNGLWAAGITISVTTNALLRGDNLMAGDILSLLGNIDGNLYARGRKITLGGTITGNVYLYGEDIVIRPGTSVKGSLNYMTPGQPIVLDAQSKVEGDLNRAEKPVEQPEAGLNFWSGIFWWAAALAVGFPFMLGFPNFTGHAVQGLRGSMVKCGLLGIAGIVLVPFLIILIFFTIIGIPLSFLLAISYMMMLYLGKFPVALALGTALLQRRGQISLASAALALVIGLIVYYSLALVPFFGSSLQTAATAFGVGSILMALAAGRGRVKHQQNTPASQTLA